MMGWVEEDYDYVGGIADGGTSIGIFDVGSNEWKVPPCLVLYNEDFNLELGGAVYARYMANLPYEDHTYM